MNADSLVAIVSVTVSGVVSIATILMNYLTSKRAEKQTRLAKRDEFYAPKITEHLRDFITAYADIKLTFYSENSELPPDTLSKFSNSAYSLAALINDKELRDTLFDVVNKVESSALAFVYHEDDTISDIIARVSNFLYHQFETSR